MKHFTVSTFFLFFLSSITICSAQIDSFKLNQIHNPDFKRKVLEFDILFDHSFNNSFEGVNSAGTDKSNGLSGTFSPKYRSVKNTDKYQGNQNIGLHLSGGTNSNMNTYVIKRTDFTGIFGYSSANRFYLPESLKKHFVINPSVSAQYDHSRRLDTNQSGTQDYRVDNTDISIGSDIGLGFGRLENISDARIILFILEELKNKNLLDREPTEEDINALSNLAIYVKNQRFFDARIKRIYELSAIDSLIKERGISKNSSVAYHTILQDNWNYAVKPLRQTGRLVQFGISPSYHKSWTTSNIGIQNSISSLSQREFISVEGENIELMGFWLYEKRHAISAIFQNNASLRAEGGLLQNVAQSSTRNQLFESKQSNRSTYYVYNISARNQFGVYPISRTYIEIAANVNYVFMSSFNTRSAKDNFLNTGLSLDTYYYFSPQLRLAALCTAQYNYSNDRFSNNGMPFRTISESNTVSTSVQISLTYKLL